MTIGPVTALRADVDIPRSAPAVQAPRPTASPTATTPRPVVADGGSATSPGAAPPADRTDAPATADASAAAQTAAAPDPVAARQTSTYVQQLLAAQVFHSAVTVSRPEQVTPERLAAYVTFLENEVGVRPVDSRLGEPVDVTS